jgi:iron complex outermembrane receptor protein
MLSAAAAAALLAAPGLASAQIIRISDGDLARLSLEELGQIEVTSVSKRPEPLAVAPGSIYVITNDDIRRSGALSLPEALRLAPNLNVNRVDAIDYSISARGFASQEAAQKLLVMIDGRSVYSTLLGGVFWDQHHVVLDDIDRIEVVSGPGGALWGANAVNGVVNVTTRSAEDTQGWLASAAAGTLDSDLRLRYGGKIGAASFRVYGAGVLRGDLRKADGSSARDGWESGQLGFRLDWKGAADGVTVQGDIHDGSIDESLGATSGYVRGANVLGRWTHQLGDAGEVQVQAYYDRVRREATLINDSLDTWDLQLQHTFRLGGSHQVVWGAGYRVTDDAFRPVAGPQLLDPAARRVSIANGFVQDEVALTPDLSLTLGLKAEDNSYTKLEFMPNLRLAWRASDSQMLWASVSRAVRNPSRVERDFSIPGLVAPGYMGSEKLIAYEAGYRSQVGDKLTVSASAFWNDYDDLRTNDLTAPGVLPIIVSNTMRGRVLGVELWGTYDVRPWWRLSAGFTGIAKRFELKPGSLDLAQFEAGGADPGYWAKLRSEFQITENVDLDLRLRFYDDVPLQKSSGYLPTKAYAEADARVAWRVRPNLELALVGNNLLQAQHAEASEDRRSEIPRSAYVSLRWTR